MPVTIIGKFRQRSSTICANPAIFIRRKKDTSPKKVKRPFFMVTYWMEGLFFSMAGRFVLFAGLPFRAHFYV